MLDCMARNDGQINYRQVHKGLHVPNSGENILVLGTIFQKHQGKEERPCTQKGLESQNVICTE